MKLQELDLVDYLEDLQIRLVRTYKGEITRTLTGKVSAFPASFITVGFDVRLLGPRDKIIAAQQLLLSADTLDISLTYEGTNIKGKFSCTNNNLAEVRDHGESHLRLEFSLVSDGSDITKLNGQKFTVKYNSMNIASNCSFGKVYKLSGGPYKLNGITLPDSQILVLKDEVVTK